MNNTDTTPHMEIEWSSHGTLCDGSPRLAGTLRFDGITLTSAHDWYIGSGTLPDGRLIDFCVVGGDTPEHDHAHIHIGREQYVLHRLPRR